MIVECPRCSARYRVEEEVLKDEPTFKCSRCSHIFAFDGDVSPRPASRPLPRTSARAAGRESESLSFAFAEDVAEPVPSPIEDHAAREPDELDPEEVEHSIDFSDDPDEPPNGKSSFETESNGAGDEEFVFGQDDEEPLGEEEPDPPAEDEDQPRFVRGEDELRVERESERKPQRPYLVFLALLALLWANVALYLRNHPTEAVAAFTRIPLAGSWLTEDHLLQMRIHLQDVEGGWQRIKDSRPVFIVSGRAVNTSPRPLKGIQIEGTLLDASGRTVDVKSIFCGNAMSMKIVKDLSSKEISLLQRLEPPQRFEIPPGESAAFTVVFMDPPEDFREFTAQVVAAQKTA